MKGLFVILIIVLFGCTNSSENESEHIDSATKITEDSHAVIDKPDTIVRLDTPITKPADTKDETPSKVYANTRFKDVTVENLGNNKFRIKGKGQIFEASFSWVIEDGHNELKKGYETTDAGAPEWGKFNFVVEAVKQRQNSTLHIVLFETSAKDGSRQYELPIKLY